MDVDYQLGPSWLLSTANTLRVARQDVVLPLPHGGQQPPERVGPRKVELSEEKAGESSCAMFLCSLDVEIDNSLVGQLTISESGVGNNKAG